MYFHYIAVRFQTDENVRSFIKYAIYVQYFTLRP
jgi:hypothetical protein